MTTLDTALKDIEFFILQNGDRQVYEAFNQGKHSLRKTFANDLDLLNCLVKGYLEFVTAQNIALPEAEQEQEQLKIKLMTIQWEAILTTLRFNKKTLDSNAFLFYIIGYVNDLIRRRSNTN